MDIQTLYNLFQATFQPDTNIRIQAELQLQQVLEPGTRINRVASRTLLVPLG
jgi:hypothetical protein